MEKKIKLNLGCGSNALPDYINVDKYGEPEYKFDLETFPWPWKTDSVDEIILNHVLEHLGQTTEIYLNIIREIYRISKNNSIVYITVPHPRHDDFLNDPTHVRAITASSFELFSKSKNEVWIEEGYAVNPLGIYLDVDFETINIEYNLENEWWVKIQNQEITEQEIALAEKKYNNVVKETKITLKVLKT
jgi:predicted SAM-dependent methyltransferase